MFEKKEEQKGRIPDFTSRTGIMIWTNQDKNGKTYMSVKVPLLGINENCFSTKKEEDKGEDSLE